MKFAKSIRKYLVEMTESDLGSVEAFELFLNKSVGHMVCWYLKGLQLLHVARHPCLVVLRDKYSLPDRVEPLKEVSRVFREGVLKDDIVCSDEHELQRELLHLFDTMFPWNSICIGDVPVSVLAMTISELNLPRTWCKSFAQQTILEVIQRPLGKVAKDGEILSEEYIQALQKCLLDEFGLKIGLSVCPLLQEKVQQYTLNTGQK